MLVSVAVLIRRRVAGGCGPAQDIADETPNAIQKLRGFKRPDAMRKQSLAYRPTRRLILSMRVNAPRCMNVTNPGFVRVCNVQPAAPHARMRVLRAVSAMLHPMMQRRVHPDCAGKGEAKRQVSGDELLQGLVHELYTVSLAVA